MIRLATAGGLTDDEIWKDEIESVYCYGVGGFVWVIKQHINNIYRKRGQEPEGNGI